MSKNKKRRLLVSVFAPVATLGLATGIALPLILHNKHDPITPVVDGDYTITFNAGEGKIASGEQTSKRVFKDTSFEDAHAPRVECESSDKCFTGWKIDGTDRYILDGDKINQDLSVTAEYKAVGEVVIVRFTAGTTGAVISGNTTIGVKQNKKLFMINKPTATKTGFRFDGWALSTNPQQVLPEGYAFQENTILVPVFAQDVAVTFNANGGTFPASQPGAEVVVHENGTKFKGFNAPYCSYGEKVFTGWYSSATEQTESTKMNEEAAIVQDTTVYAGWTDVVTGWSYLSFEPDDVNTTVVGNNYEAVQGAVDQWGTGINKPTATHQDKKFDHWVFAESYTGTLATDPQTQKTYQVGDTPDENLLFTGSDEPIAHLKPAWASPVVDVFVEGPTTLDMGRYGAHKYQYQAYVLGDLVTRSVTWSLWNADGTAALDESIAVINSDGLLQTKQYNQTISFKVRATSVVDTSKYSEVLVTLNDPTINSDRVWTYHRESPEGNEYNWYSFDLNELCNKNVTKFTATKLTDGTTYEVNREDFNTPIILGENINVVPNNFLYNCTSFDSTINLNNANMIDGAFLWGCTSFQQALDVSKIVRFGESFMYGCTQFSSSLNLTNAIQLGEDFLMCCSNFDQPITMPKVKYIESGFLFSCTAFNQDITFPATIGESGKGYIADYCMTNCNAFTSTITINCDLDYVTKQQHNFSADTASAAIYTQGFNVAGASATAFREAFPTMEDAQLAIFRKLNQQ